MPLNTELFSEKFRSRAIIVDEKKILIARLSGSKQEKDFSAPVNSGGYGRVRHFHLNRNSQWSFNPLPIFPASRAFNIKPPDMMRAQVFQNAACNWRCWYCFVDFDRLSANRQVSEFFTADELVSLYLDIDSEQRPLIIDLSGGQPDLVPEWILWMIDAIKSKGLENKVFLWSDDNLSNYYYWEYLTSAQRKVIASHPMYARVGCFKGYDENSFHLNTLAEPALFLQQFDIFERMLHEGIDLYGYVTFTAMPHKSFRARVSEFVDRLQNIHPNLPLRVVPLEICEFTPNSPRISPEHREAMRFQHVIHAAWKEELATRFSEAQRAMDISTIILFN